MILAFITVQFVTVNCFGVNFLTWLHMQYRRSNNPYYNEYERKRPNQLQRNNDNKQRGLRNDSMINSTGNSFRELYRPMK